MSEENVEMVRRAWTAFFGGNREAALAVVDPDVVTVRAEPLPHAGTYHGIDGLLEAYGDWSSGFGDFEMTLEELIDAGDHVIVEAINRGRGLASGAAVQGRFWFLSAVAGGKIVRLEILNSREQAIESANVATVRRIAELWSAGDPALWDLFHEDAVSIASPSWFDVAEPQGVSEMRRNIEDFGSSFREMSVEEVSVEPRGDDVLVIGAWVARGLTSGAGTRAPFYVIFTFRAGRVARVQWFDDAESARAVVDRRRRA